MTEHFKNITQRFSIVDVLAFIIPGAFLILNACWFGGSVAQDIIFKPVERGFPDNLVMRIVYFGFMSYVAGMLISEASWIMEKFFRCLDDISAFICAEPRAQGQAQTQGQQGQGQGQGQAQAQGQQGQAQGQGEKPERRSEIPNIMAIALTLLGACLSLGSWKALLQVLLLFALAFGAVCFSRGFAIWLENIQNPSAQASGNPPAQTAKPWRGILTGLVLMGASALTLWFLPWETLLLKLIKGGASWKTVGLLLFITGASVWLRRASKQSHDMKSLKKSELFRKAQLFQAYYELFRAFCAVELVLYLILCWKQPASNALPNVLTALDMLLKVRIFPFLALEFLSAERMLRFKKLKGDYYDAYDALRQKTPESSADEARVNPQGEQ